MNMVQAPPESTQTLPVKSPSVVEIEDEGPQNQKASTIKHLDTVVEQPQNEESLSNIPEQQASGLEGMVTKVE